MRLVVGWLPLNPYIAFHPHGHETGKDPDCLDSPTAKDDIPAESPWTMLSRLGHEWIPRFSNPVWCRRTCAGVAQSSVHSCERHTGIASCGSDLFAPGLSRLRKRSKHYPACSMLQSRLWAGSWTVQGADSRQACRGQLAWTLREGNCSENIQLACFGYRSSPSRSRMLLSRNLWIGAHLHPQSNTLSGSGQSRDSGHIGWLHDRRSFLSWDQQG